MQAISILASGMVTGVGLNASASCAAIRAGISNFSETRFMNRTGDWIIGSSVPLDPPWRGRAKLLHLVAPAIKECLAAVNGGIEPSEIPLLLCVAEKDRPGRLEGLDDLLLDEVQNELGVRFHNTSTTIALGRTGGAIAVKSARDLLGLERRPYCIIAGVDTLLIANTLAAYEERERLLTANNSNGFIPGEAGAAILIGPAQQSGCNLLVSGIGFGTEKATIESEEPLRAEGLVQAIREALAGSGLNMGDLDFRITDANGEQYSFKEASLALARLLRVRKEEFDIWHPADCIGEVGAAALPCILSVALAAVRKDYTPGKRILCHIGNDDGGRAALIVTCSNGVI